MTFQPYIEDIKKIIPEYLTMHYAIYDAEELEYIEIFDKSGIALLRINCFKDVLDEVSIMDLSVNESNRHKGWGTLLVKLAEQIIGLTNANIITIYINGDSWIPMWCIRMGYFINELYNDKNYPENICLIKILHPLIKEEDKLNYS